MSDVDSADKAFADWWQDNAHYFPATHRDEVKLAFISGMKFQNKLWLEYFKDKEKGNKHE